MPTEREYLTQIHALVHQSEQPAPVPVPVPPPPIAALPNPPKAGYAIASGALPIRTKDELVAALAGTAVKDWVVEDGDYDTGAMLNDINGHRLQARNLGKAILRNGMQLGGNWGPGGRTLQGFHFDVKNRAYTVGGSGHILSAWEGQSGSAKDTGIRDCTFNGNKTMLSAIWLTSAFGGGIVQRVKAWDLTDWGVGAAGPNPVAAPVLFEDIDVRGVTRAVPKSANGTAEACLWAGQRGIYRRVYADGGAWMGIWTGGKCFDTVLEDLTVRNTLISIYPEHKTLRTTFRRFDLLLPLGSNGRGVTCEWYDVFGPGNGSTNDSMFEDGIIKGGHIGIAWNSGCKRNTAQRVKFVGQTIAAIEDLDDNPTTNKYIDNDYTQIAAGAVPISRTLHNF